MQDQKLVDLLVLVIKIYRYQMYYVFIVVILCLILTSLHGLSREQFEEILKRDHGYIQR